MCGRRAGRRAWFLFLSGQFGAPTRVSSLSTAPFHHCHPSHHPVMQPQYISPIDGLWDANTFEWRACNRCRSKFACPDGDTCGEKVQPNEPGTAIFNSKIKFYVKILQFNFIRHHTNFSIRTETALPLVKLPSALANGINGSITMRLSSF